MVYTIRIQDNSKKAKSIINLLKTLQADFDFIEISEEYDKHDDAEIMKVLEVRYNSFKSDPKGKDWDVLLKELNR